MNRPIKFRGRDIQNGEFVYATLGEVSAELNPNYITFITEDGVFTISYDSIEQFIGVDKYGRDVYEGDTVIRISPAFDDETDGRNYPMSATFEDFAAIQNGEIILQEVKK